MIGRWQICVSTYVCECVLRIIQGCLLDVCGVRNAGTWKRAVTPPHPSAAIPYAFAPRGLPAGRMATHCWWQPPPSAVRACLSGPPLPPVERAAPAPAVPPAAPALSSHVCGLTRQMACLPARAPSAVLAVPSPTLRMLQRPGRRGLASRVQNGFSI